jgi:hypothetical protein
MKSGIVLEVLQKTQFLLVVDLSKYGLSPTSMLAKITSYLVHSHVYLGIF